MINLINLTKKERIDVSLKCESFFLQSKRVNKFKPIFNELIKYTDKKNTRELWCLITACCKAVRYGSIGSKLPRTKERYLEANKKFNCKLSSERMKVLLGNLEQCELIQTYKGFNDGEWAMTSCFVMSQELLDMIPVDEAKRYALKREPEEFVRIKDYDKKVFITEFRGINGLNLYRNQMDNLNRFLENQDISINGLKVNVCYVRIFADSLKGAGRYYSSNGFMNYESKYRRTIRINGSNVTEIDFSTLHPLLCLMLEGKKAPEDWKPYSIDDGIFPNLCDNGVKQLRLLCKKALMAVLYSETEEKAVKSVYYEFNMGKREDYTKIPITCKDDANKIIKSIVNRNQNISKHFFVKGGWKKLQNLDSRLCSYILNKFTGLGKVCLPYHDSWVVCVEDQEFLIETMRGAWVSLFGTDMNFKYDIEF